MHYCNECHLYSCSWNWQGRTSAFLVLLANTVQVLEFHHFQAANQGTVIQDFFVGWV